MTQDTEVEVARVNRGMSLRHSKKKSNLLNDARIKACICRYDNDTYTHIQFLCVVGHCVGSHVLCPEDGSAESDVDDDDNQEEVSVDSGDDGRPAVSRCWISGSLRSLHDSTARHTTSACALRTPALFQVLWFLHHKDWGRRPRLPDVPRANHHDSAPVLVFYSWISQTYFVLSTTVFQWHLSAPC